MFNELQFIDEYDSFGLPLFIMYRREASMPISLRLKIIFVVFSGSLPGKNPGIYDRTSSRGSSGSAYLPRGGNVEPNLIFC